MMADGELPPKFFTKDKLNMAGIVREPYTVKHIISYDMLFFRDNELINHEKTTSHAALWVVFWEHFQLRHHFFAGTSLLE